MKSDVNAALLSRFGALPFLTDGGIETFLIFNDGFDLPCFASFTLLDDPRGIAGLRGYYRKFLEMAGEFLGNVEAGRIEQRGERLERFRTPFQVLPQFALLRA